MLRLVEEMTELLYFSSGCVETGFSEIGQELFDAIWRVMCAVPNFADGRAEFQGIALQKIEKKDIGMLRLNAETSQYVVWKILEIPGDDQIATTMNCCR